MLYGKVSNLVFFCNFVFRIVKIIIGNPDVGFKLIILSIINVDWFH